MLLVLTSSDDSTADYLCQRLSAESLSFIRFNTDSASNPAPVYFEIGDARMCVDHRWFTSQEISDVWYRRPKPWLIPENHDTGASEHSRAEWCEALEGVLGHIPFSRWMNHPAFNFAASHKLEQLSRARKLGLNVPKSLVTVEPSRLAAFWEECAHRLIVKPLSAGYIERDDTSHDSIIYTSVVRADDMLDLESLALCPTLFQERVSKQMDVRINIVDEFVHATTLTAQDGHEQRVDIRRNNMIDVTYGQIAIPSEVRDALRTLVTSYQLRFAAIDCVVDTDGRWVFLELNPNGQWAWLDLVGQMDVAAGFLQAFGSDGQ